MVYTIYTIDVLRYLCICTNSAALQIVSSHSVALQLKAEKSGSRAIQPKPSTMVPKKPTPSGSTGSHVASGVRTPSGRMTGGKGRSGPRS